MTPLYLDTEFNGFGGELISLALVGDDGSQWYNVLPLPRVIDPWVAKHVVPFLGKDPVDPFFFRASLIEFLADRPGVRILADWPADHGYLLNCLMGSEYESAFYRPMTLEILTGTDAKPLLPHNALSDAIALRDWYNANRESHRLTRLLRAIADLKSALRDYGTRPDLIGIPSVDHKAFRETLRIEGRPARPATTRLDTSGNSLLGVQIVPHQERGE